MTTAGITLTINMIADPMWLFPYKNSLNSKQLAIAERLQKTNYLTYRQPSFNAILIGNSRVLYMNQNDFSGLNVFNYSASALIVPEYQDYIGYARKVTTDKMKTIFLGLSFASSNDIFSTAFRKSPPVNYIGTVNDSMNRFKTSINPAILKFSWSTIKFNLIDDSKIHIFFDRQNVAYDNKLNAIHRRDNLSKDLENYWKSYKKFHYDPTLKNDYRTIKEKNKDLTIIPFTTPVSKPLHCQIAKAGLIPEYEEWIRDIVVNFGELYHFEYIHSIAENYQENFMDANHYFPKIGTLMAKKIQGDNVGVPDDFGMIINNSNIEQQLTFLRNNFAKCK